MHIHGRCLVESYNFGDRIILKYRLFELSVPLCIGGRGGKFRCPHCSETIQYYYSPKGTWDRCRKKYINNLFLCLAVFMFAPPSIYLLDKLTEPQVIIAKIILSILWLITLYLVPYLGLICLRKDIVHYKVKSLYKHPLRSRNIHFQPVNSFRDIESDIRSKDGILENEERKDRNTCSACGKKLTRWNRAFGKRSDLCGTCWNNLQYKQLG